MKQGCQAVSPVAGRKPWLELVKERPRMKVCMMLKGLSVSL